MSENIPTPTESSIVTTTTLTDASSITPFNRGPITSLFSAPDSCTQTLTLKMVGTEPRELFVGHFNHDYIDLACYPPRSDHPELLVPPASWDTFFYSPAICPQSWTEATTFTSLFPGVGLETFISIGSETTVAVCCPSNYSYKENGHLCTSTLTQGQVVSFVNPSNRGVSFERGQVIMSTILVASSVLGDGVPIWWQSSDSSKLAAASTISTPRSTITSSSTISTNTTTPGPTGEPSPGGLATGAKIGIGVGIPIAVILCAIVAFLFFRRRRNAGAAGANASHEPYYTGVPQDGGYHPGHNEKPDAQPLDASQHIYEADPGNPMLYHSRHELPEHAHR